MDLQQKYPSFFDEEGSYIVGSKENRIERLKDAIRETDYIAIKHSEGIDCTEYGDWRSERQALRDEINALEQMTV